MQALPAQRRYARGRPHILQRVRRRARRWVPRPNPLLLSVSTTIGVSQPSRTLAPSVLATIGVASTVTTAKIPLSVSTTISVGGRGQSNPGELLSGRRRGGIFDFERTSDGTLFLADGAAGMMKWDGFSAQVETVGVIAPTTAMGMTSSGQGAIIGTYYGYSRFVDKDNNPSALSPISAAFQPVGPSSTIGGTPRAIQNAQKALFGFTYYVRITAHGHGLPLTPFNTVSTTAVTIAGIVGSTGTTGVEVANGAGFVFVDTVDTFFCLRASPLADDYTSGGTWTGNANGVSVSNTTPIVVTSAGHGLTTGTVVKIVGVNGNDAANGVWTITVTDPNTFSLDTSSGDGEYLGGGTWTAGVQTITYTSVPVPTEAKVTRRQILRNTDGQAAVWYVDIDTTDLTSTVLSSTTVDAVLQTNTAVPLFDSNGTIFANQYGIPPDWKASLANHQGRMYAAVEIVVNEGHAIVTFGSKTVTGIGTNWLSNWTGRFFYVTGADKSYEIASISGQVMTLLTPYQGPTDLFAQYAIKPAPAERKLVYYSGAGLPEAWNPTFAFAVQEDGDEITGLMPMASFLYILEERHIYRWTSQSDPAIDGFLYLAGLRGCINKRCWVVVEDQGYLLDGQGIHKFAGGPSEPISQPIQDLFRPSATSELRINWAASAYFHAGHYPAQDCIRWFVSLDGSPYPRHAIGYNYRQERWWVEAFPWAVTASCVWPQVTPRLMLGGEFARVLAYWQGTLDGPAPSDGTVRGTATASTLASLTDSAAVFPASGVVNAPLCIVSGKGKGQVRKIVSVSGTTLNVSLPWLDVPDTTSKYQIGGVQWDYRTGWFRWIITGANVERSIEVMFLPLDGEATMDLRYFHDFDNAEPCVYTVSSRDNDGVLFTNGSSDAVVDLTKENGLIKIRLPQAKDLYLKGHRFVSLELRGFSNADQVQVYQIQVEGVE